MAQTHKTYAENLIAELNGIAEEYNAILSRSGIKYINPNRSVSPIIFIASADYGWAESDDELESSRMSLLGEVRNWEPRFRLLFPHPTPSVKKRIKADLKHLKRWLVRSDADDYSIPSTIRRGATTSHRNYR